MRAICVQMRIEMQSLRINRLSTTVSFLVLPLTYALVSLLSQPAGSVSVSYVASGSLVASIMSILFGFTLMRTSNLFQPQILELHAAFPIRKSQLMLAAWLTYLVLTLPIAGTLFAVSVLTAPVRQTVLALAGLVSSCLMISALAAAVGLLVRNPYRAQGVMALASWALVFLSPMQQSTAQLPSFAQGLLLLNPVTHAINMIRPFLGFDAIVPPFTSFLFAAVIVLAVFPFLVRAVRHITMIERFF